MKNMINIGIVGCGIIGGVLKQWIEKHNLDCNIIVSDPPEGYYGNMNNADIVFINIHIPTEEDGSQNLSLLKSILNALPDKPIFIRTTILPGTCKLLREILNKRIYYMPEFLTERTAYADFCSQSMIFCGEKDLLSKVFVGKKYVEMTSEEAEIVKYAHNVFGALKVTFFNGIYEMAKQNGCDYEAIKRGVLLSGHINEPHTQVPGPDGKFGFGGKCFPKDVLAFIKTTEGRKLNKLIRAVETLNNYYRNKLT
jgi:UDPglucose 6-dehydrogenase